MYDDFIHFVKTLFGEQVFIPLHAPAFYERDKEYVLDAIDSTYVSSVGEYVDRFEECLASYAGISRSVATVNGTAALQTALKVVGVQQNHEVITQPLTFVATANAISHVGAIPVFVDVDRDTMGLSPFSLSEYLEDNGVLKNGILTNKKTGRQISAIVPVHTFGHPCRIHHIVDIADKWNIPVVEDAAEAIGSWAGKNHCGTIGDIGIISFNGNKTITCGGGGALLTNNNFFADRAKHLTTTAKSPHAWKFYHDEVGYNYRMPNLNAALACAQLERLDDILCGKRSIAGAYHEFFKSSNWARFVDEPLGTTSNYWLCTLLLHDPERRDSIITTFNDAGIMTRPAWELMNRLPMYAHCPASTIPNATWLQKRIVNIPSGVKNNGKD